MEQVTLSKPAAFSSNSEISPKINIAVDLAKLWTEGKPLINQKLKEFNIRIKTFKEMAWIKDYFRLFKNYKYINKTIKDPINQPGPFMP